MEADLSNDFQPIVSASYSPDEDLIESYYDVEDKLRSKLTRSSEQILNSIKKRRAKSSDRVTGRNLELLAQKIVEQCRIAI